MRVLYVNTFYDPYEKGGAETAVRLQSHSLQSKGVKATVLCTSDQKGLKKDSVDGVDVFRLGIKNLFWHYSGWPSQQWKRLLWHAVDMFNPFVIGPASRVIAEVKPHLMVCHNLMGLSCAAWVAASLRKVPIIQVLHDQYLLCARSTMYRHGINCKTRCLVCRVAKCPVRVLNNLPTAVVGVSSFILNRFLEFDYFNKVPIRRVIHNFSDVGTQASGKNRFDVLGRGRGIRFGFIGRMTREKGIDLLLNIFKNLDANNAKLLVAGDLNTPLAQDLFSRYSEDKRIHFLGRVKKEEFYPMVDVVVVPSLWHDTFPTVVLEAMSFGLPVIASRNGGIPEMVKHGETGLLFDVSVKDDLKTKLLQVISNTGELRSMGVSAKRRSERFSDPQRYIDSYFQLFKDVLRLKQECSNGC